MKKHRKKFTRRHARAHNDALFSRFTLSERACMRVYAAYDTPISNFPQKRCKQNRQVSHRNKYLTLAATKWPYVHALFPLLLMYIFTGFGQ